MARALLPFARATRAVLRGQGWTFSQQMLSPAVLYSKGLRCDLQQPGTRRSYLATPAGFALATDALQCRQRKSTVHCPDTKTDIDHSEIFPVEQLWVSPTPGPGPLAGQTPLRAGWVWPEPKRLRRAVVHIAVRVAWGWCACVCECACVCVGACVCV